VPTRGEGVCRSAWELVPRVCRLPYRGPVWAAAVRCCPASAAQPIALPRALRLLPTWRSPVRARSDLETLIEPEAAVEAGSVIRTWAFGIAQA
jgi:hypothetical protein